MHNKLSSRIKGLEQDTYHKCLQSVHRSHRRSSLLYALPTLFNLHCTGCLNLLERLVHVAQVIAC